MRRLAGAALDTTAPAFFSDAWLAGGAAGPIRKPGGGLLECG
jgi:hypothetical protein